MQVHVDIHLDLQVYMYIYLNIQMFYGEYPLVIVYLFFNGYSIRQFQDSESSINCIAQFHKKGITKVA